MSPSYSTTSRRAYALLYRPFNDIDLYVEDGSIVNLHENYFLRVLEVPIARVIPLGPKDIVIAAAQSPPADGRPKLFVVDGDLHLLTNYGLPRVDGLLRLKRYAIENYVLDEWALIEALRDGLPGQSRQTIEQTVRSEIDLSLIASMFGFLFILYAICFRANFTQAIVAHRVERYIDRSPKTFTVSRSKIVKRIGAVMRALIGQAGWQEYFKAKALIRRNLARKSLTSLDIVCAKSHILPVAQQLGALHLNYRGSVRQLATTMARYCAISGELRRLAKGSIITT